MTAQPLTKANDLIDRMNALREVGTYLGVNDFQWRLMRRECDQLIQVDPGRGWSVLGMLYTVVGDAVEADACFQRSSRLTSEALLSLNWITARAAVGHYQAAQELLAEFLRLQEGGALVAVETSLEIGAFIMIRDQLKVARKMGLDLSALPVEDIERAASIMDAAGVSDGDVARHLEAAGAVLRDHRLFDMIRGDLLTSTIEGGLNAITMVLRVKGTASEVFKLNKELARKEREMEVKKSPVFDVLIASAN